MSAALQLTEPQKCDAWRAGVVAPWYLRPSQLDVYSLLLSSRNPFIEASRRFGKTTSILAYVFEQLRANPGWVCRWILPEKAQARTIVMPEIEKIQALCPMECRAEFQTTDTVYLFPNGSKLFLYGVDKDKGKRLRGPFAHIIVCDELGSWRDATIINSILRPQLLTTRGQLIIASTPSDDMAHMYYLLKGRAIAEKRFVQKTIYDNESLTEQDINDEMHEQGGENSETWRREYLCKEVHNKKLQVVPEYSDKDHDLPDNAPRPEFYDCYVMGDSGFDDNTAILFAYVDWVNQVLVIDDELVESGTTTEKIISAAKAKEISLWGAKRKDGAIAAKSPRIRVLDATKQSLYDIAQTHDYPVSLPDKQDRDANYRLARIAFSNGRIKIRERCVNLRYQLRVGHWRDEKHTDFKRTPTAGHLDAIAALFYGFRSIDWNHNPFPQNVGVSVYTHQVQPSPSNPSDEALKSAFASGPWSGFGL